MTVTIPPSSCGNESLDAVAAGPRSRRSLQVTEAANRAEADPPVGPALGEQVAERGSERAGQDVRGPEGNHRTEPEAQVRDGDQNDRRTEQEGRDPVTEG